MQVKTLLGCATNSFNADVNSADVNSYVVNFSNDLHSPFVEVDQ